MGVELFQAERRTGGLDEANSRFSQFRVRAYKKMPNKRHEGYWPQLVLTSQAM